MANSHGEPRHGVRANRLRSLVLAQPLHPAAQAAMMARVGLSMLAVAVTMEAESEFSELHGSTPVPWHLGQMMIADPCRRWVRW